MVTQPSPFKALEASKSPNNMSNELQRITERVRTAAVRSFGTGMILRGGLHGISRLLSLVKKGKGGKDRRTVSLVDALMESMRTGLLLASIAAMYVASEEGVRLIAGKDESAQWRCLVAGMLAGLGIMLAPKSGRSSLATYIFLRGLTVLLRSLNKESSPIPPLIRTILSVTRMDHGDVALMCLSGSVILYCFIMQPSALPSSYVRWIMRQGATEPWVWAAIREQAVNNSSDQCREPLKMLRGTRFEARTFQPSIPCEFWHPGQSCSSHVISNVPGSFLRSLRVYLPVYVFPAILVHRFSLISKPWKIWPKIASGVLRSSVFLTLYIALAFGGACAGFSLFQVSTGSVIASSIWLGGLATFVEKPSRRLELALFSTSRALESLASALISNKMIPEHLVPPHFDVILFSLGCGLLMHCYGDNRGQHRDCFRSKYQSVIDFIFGAEGMIEGRVRHEASNLDLLRKLLPIKLAEQGIKRSSSEPGELMNKQ